MFKIVFYIKLIVLIIALVLVPFTFALSLFFSVVFIMPLIYLYQFIKNWKFSFIYLIQIGLGWFLYSILTKELSRINGIVYVSGGEAILNYNIYIAFYLGYLMILSSLLPKVDRWRRWHNIIRLKFLHKIYRLNFIHPPPCGYSLHLPAVGRKGDKNSSCKILHPSRGEF